MESWQKWSFPIAPLRHDGDALTGWRAVRKRRRISRFSLAGGPVATQAPGLGQEPRCAVELTEVRTPGQDWWTLGFEATGPDDLLRFLRVFLQAHAPGSTPFAAGGPDGWK
jgi:hypothetical protein